MTVDQMLDEAFVHHQAGRLPEAEHLYRDAIGADPDRWGACLNLTKILMLTDRLGEAQRWLQWRLEDTPDDLTAHRQLGFSYLSEGKFAPALVHFQRVIEHDPRDAGAHEIIAHLLQGAGQQEASKRNFNLSAALRDPVQVGFALGRRPAFRALMLFAPGAGNTPYMYLLRVVTYDCHVLSVVAGIDYDIDALRASTDIVFNLIGDVDTSDRQLESAAALITQLGKPVVNHPDRIALTGRQSNAERLSAIPGCVMPATRHYTAAQMHDAVREATRDPMSPQFFGSGANVFEFPLLVRRAGTHGGEDFDKVANPNALKVFVEQTQATHYYVTQFVDYRSDDGYFRKYRFMCIDGEILPYHLAIDDQWKVHHATTDMVNQQWMQDEEIAYLDDPRAVFGEPQYAVLRAIRDTIGLDYWGIDCGLDREGRIVVFEANATMLVHTQFQKFPYKRTAVARIKRAFDAMLERRAALARHMQGGTTHA
ncbi:MAG TPA: tetratricopeptide repeat protein [Pararobbsia sp.]|nr:tetratricopeptide repeat protein [Pararobbsia sp.]